MKGSEYRRRIAELGLSQVGAAEFFRVSPRTGRYWVKDGPSAQAEMLLLVMEGYGLTVEDICIVCDRMN